MSEAFLGELRMYSYSFAPKGWAICNGQTMQIKQNPKLFSLLSTRYGGDGNITFKLPDLQARMPIHPGPGFTQGQPGGEANHTINTGETPIHTHNIIVNPITATSNDPKGKTFANSNGANLTNAYAPAGSSAAPMSSGMLALIGGHQPHSNEQPYLVINWCISLQGIYPQHS